MATRNMILERAGFVGRLGRAALPRALVAGIVGLAIAGCSRAPDAAGEAPATGASRDEAFTYADGDGSTSFVQRRTDAEGHDVLHGRTQVAHDTTSTEIVEDATLDGSGALLRAEVSISSRCGAPAELRMVFDRASGTVRVEGRGGAGSFQVPAGAPVAYAPLADDAGREPATPVAAWVAFRAAGTSPAVRMIDVARRATYLAPVDQLAIPTELGTTVVLGNSGVGVDMRSGFVDEVRLVDLGVRLTRSAEPPPSPLLACDGRREPRGGRVQ